MKRSARLLGLVLLMVLVMTTATEPVVGGGVAIWRLQIEVFTGNADNSETDDNISVSLKRDNLTWLDYGRNDFERNRGAVYDLLQNGNLGTLNDITHVRFRKDGNDGWCLLGFVLYVNQGEYTLDGRSSRCRWLDNDDGYSREMTFSNLNWSYGGANLRPNYLERSEIEGLLESAVGHRLYGDPLYWDNDDGRVVSVSRTNSSTVHVDLDLMYSLNNSTDPSVDVDYDIEFYCNGGVLDFSVQNVRVETGFSIGTSTVIISSHPLIEFSAERLRNSVARLNDANCNMRVLEGTSIALN